ncbi:MAG: CBS domain-containing protein [Candidatus Bathyarchaeota archaeon]|nr:MAG: CBS domain-containing protein [Candidatus Bathyarchaeota archaeon]
MSLEVKDVMVKNVMTVEAEATVMETAKLMNKHDIECLVVMKRGKPVGMVTERDILKRVLLKSKVPQKTKVSKIMSKPLVVSERQTDIRDAVRLMVEGGIKRLPVVEDSHLLGLVTFTDIVRSSAYFERIISSFCSRCPWKTSQEGSH